MRTNIKLRKLFDGRYEIHAIIGKGGRSVVYRAKVAAPPELFVNLPPLGGDIALKVSTAPLESVAAKDNLRNEAESLTLCKHPHVVKLYDMQNEGKFRYLALQFATSGDLRNFVHNGTNRISLESIFELYRQCLLALSSVHAVGMVHRDVKPENILINRHKEILLADFGVAVKLRDPSNVRDLMRNLDTLAYQAPEVLQGDHYDERSDLYSLALTFYELLSGYHPFAHAPQYDQEELRSNGLRPEDLNAIAGEGDLLKLLTAPILASLKGDPSERLESASQALRELNGTEILTATTLKSASNVEESEALSEISSDVVGRKDDDTDLHPDYHKPSSPKVDDSNERYRIGQARTEVISSDLLEKLRSGEVGAKQEANVRRKTEKGKSIPERQEITPTRKFQNRLIATLLLLFLLSLLLYSFRHQLPLLTALLSNKKLETVKEEEVLTPTELERMTELQKPPLTLKLPVYKGDALLFPNLPPGVFRGTITNLIPKRELSLTIISYGKDAGLNNEKGIPPKLVIIGLDGFQTQLLYLSETEARMRVAGSGYLLQFRAKESEVAKKEIIGVVQNITTGEEGRFTLAPQ
jgi:serine/threonine protein kinase